MALIFTVIYPNGETAEAVGYPDQVLRVDIVPRGPEACLHDEVECEFRPDYTAKVLRIVGGPRRRTIHVRVAGDRDAWMDARDSEGWWTLPDRDEDDVVWLVPVDDDRDLTQLVSVGVQILRPSDELP